MRQYNAVSETFDINQHVALERIQGLYNDSRVVSFTAVIAAILMGAMLWSSQPQHLVITWITAHIFIAFLRGVLLHQTFKKRMGNLDDATTWAKLYTLIALLSGCVWATLPWTMFDHSSTYNVSAIVIVMFGMSAASNVALSAYPAAFFAFAIPSLGGLFFRLINEGGDFAYVGIMLLAFIAFSLIQSVRIYRMITSSIQKRFENDILLHNLEIKKQEAEKANLDKSRFLAATSHDLRQPLHALDLYLGVLEVALSQKEHLHILYSAKKSSQSVGELLNALLDISRLDAGEVVINKQNISLPTLFDDLKSEWQPQLEEGGRTLRTHAIHATLKTDPILISRMLRNILANAIRHTQGDVLLGARKHNDIVRIEVWDQGNGISNADQQHIFTEFFQVNNPERDRTKGLGLGLAIVKRLSLLLNHPIKLKSFEGKGLCFSIEIPVAQESITTVPLERMDDIDDMDCFILVIDDEKDIRHSLQLLLLSWGCEVLVADSQDAAIHEMKRDNYPAPNIILADYRLRKGKTGIEAAQAISELFQQPIPTMIVTGDTDPNIAVACASLGFTLLHKPLSSEKLKRELRKLSQLKSSFKN